MKMTVKRRLTSLWVTVALCLGGLLATWVFVPYIHGMSHQIETQVLIHAPAERVWSVLLDFPGHAQWNPFIRHIGGRAEVGGKLNIQIQPVGGREMAFSPTVLVAQPLEEFRWKGQFIMPGLFDGEHYFLLRPDGAGGVLWVHGEKFSGLLVPFFRSSLETGTRAGFQAMNEALRQISERR
ncbi:MAG: SRPBCC domain-containing protein [Pseudomonadota bacterium]